MVETLTRPVLYCSHQGVRFSVAGRNQAGGRNALDRVLYSWRPKQGCRGRERRLKEEGESWWDGREGREGKRLADRFRPVSRWAVSVRSTPPQASRTRARDFYRRILRSFPLHRVFKTKISRDLLFLLASATLSADGGVGDFRPL